MKVVLKIKTPEAKQEYNLEYGQMIAIGRSGQCELTVNDAKISSRHCRFQLLHDRLEIFDLDSKNGTYLNSIRIENSEMFIGDEVKIGDSVITMEESKMTPEAINVLTFPGPFKDRISYELKADFTGARIQNQLTHKRTPDSSINSPSHEKEINLRKKIKSNIKLSKQEIRSRNKVLSGLTTILDSALVFCAFSLPLATLVKHIPASVGKDHRTYITLALMATSGLAFILLNFRASKFTIGERVLGIQSLYQKQ